MEVLGGERLPPLLRRRQESPGPDYLLYVETRSPSETRLRNRLPPPSCGSSTSVVGSVFRRRRVHTSRGRPVHQDPVPPSGLDSTLQTRPPIPLPVGPRLSVRSGRATSEDRSVTVCDGSLRSVPTRRDKLSIPLTPGLPLHCPGSGVSSVLSTGSNRGLPFALPLSVVLLRLLSPSTGPSESVSP